MGEVVLVFSEVLLILKDMDIKNSRSVLAGSNGQEVLN